MVSRLGKCLNLGTEKKSTAFLCCKRKKKIFIFQGVQYPVVHVFGYNVADIVDNKIHRKEKLCLPCYCEVQ